MNIMHILRKSLAITLVSSMLFTSCALGESVKAVGEVAANVKQEQDVKIAMLKEVKKAQQLSNIEEEKAQAEQKIRNAKQGTKFTVDPNAFTEDRSLLEAQAAKETFAASASSSGSSGEKSDVDKMQNIMVAPYQIQNSASENITANSGTLGYTYNIPNSVIGLKMRYSSDNTQVDRWTFAGNNQPMTEVAPYEMYLSRLGVGWTWDIPYMDGGNVHLAGGESFYYCIGMYYYGDDADLCRFEKYNLKDKQMYEDTTYTQGDMVSKYRVDYKTGEKVYFSAAGPAICQIDRLGNKTSYGYTTINGYYALTSITDSLGRVTTISYTAENGKRVATVINPDNSQVKIYMSDTTNSATLDKVIDPMNRETIFNYNTMARNFSQVGSSNNIDKKTSLLTSITYPTTAQTVYTYNKSIEAMGEYGQQEIYKIHTREDKIGSVSYQKKTYDYNGTYTGYPLGEAQLPTTYTYQVSITSDNGMQEKHTFNKDSLNTITQIYDTTTTTPKLLSQEDSTYNTDKQMTKKITTSYNVSDDTHRSVTEEYTYDTTKYGDMLSYTNTNSDYANYTYDSTFHQKKTEQTPKGNVTYTINATTGNVDKMVKSNLEVSYVYDARGNVTKQTSRDTTTNKTRVENFEYSSAYNGGYLTKKSTTATGLDGTNVTTQESYTYDFNKGVLTKTIHPNGTFTTYEYDAVGRKTKETAPQVGTTLTSMTIAYDDINRTTTVTDETGYSMRATYDALGNKLLIEDKPDTTWRVQETDTYNTLGQLVSSKNALNNITSYEYDILGRAKKTINPDKSYTHIEYFDGEGKTVAYDEENHSKTTYTDLKGRTTKEEVPYTQRGVAKTSIYQYQYNAADNVIKTTDANNNIQNYSYDTFGNLTSGLNTTYTYDAFSNLVKTTYPKGNTEENTYDELGRVTKTTDSLGKTAKNYYNALGQLYKSTDRKGQTTLYTYDARARLTNATTGDIINVTEYDKADRVTKKTNSAGSQRFIYTKEGLLERQFSEDVKSITYEYDALGRRTKVTDYQNKATTYSYNSRNKVTNISAPNWSVSYSYNADGTIKYSTGYGVDEFYTYDEQNRVTKLTSKDVEGKAAYTYNYSYDANGNMATKEALKSNLDRPQQVESYSYDSLNRVKNVGTMDYSLTYTYDANSNIVSEYNSNPKKSYTTNYTYDNNNRLTQSKVDDNSNILDFTYDDNGNMISKSQTVAKTSTDSATVQTSQLGTVSNTLTDTAYYDYNAVNQLTGYQNLNGVKESFTYDVNGLRNSKTYAGQTTKFYYDGDNVVNETKNGNLSAVNFYNAQGQVASRQNYVDHVPTQGYIYYDAHGDARNVRDNTLSVIAEYQYNLYGKEEKATGTFDNPFRYTGQYYDSESGMYYLRARFYDPDLKRFISEDTHWNTGNSIYGDKSYKENEIRYPSSAAMMQSGNLYGYCSGNPVNRCDVTGNVSEKVAAQRIKDNASNIIAAAKEFGVNPAILAAVIYAEQVLNVNYTEGVEDFTQAMLDMDCSVGVSQVRISTAKKVEDAGYISKTSQTTTSSYIYTNPFTGKAVYDTKVLTRESKIYDKLKNNSTNIRYAAAYLSLIQDKWKSSYPEIDGRTAVLATLYNIGEKGTRGPNSNPGTNDFGDFARANYSKMQDLLGLD